MEFTSPITKVNACMVTGTENSPMQKMDTQLNQSLDLMDTPGISWIIHPPFTVIMSTITIKITTTTMKMKTTATMTKPETTLCSYT